MDACRQVLPQQPLSSTSTKMAMDFEFRGSASRIKNCAFDLLSTWEDLLMEDDCDDDDDVLWDPKEEDDNDEWWDLMQRDLRLKSTFFFCDFNQMISAAPHDDQKKSLTQLANKLLSSIQQLDEASSVRSIHLTQERYKDVAFTVKEVMALLP
ncbi:photosynthetic NDH subunit of lumenal location 3, chloroplastic-like [Malania oleifera]|uniref:photosynthetic NDH subunit of lumenal location 3, chloroplastic-like n=1 Tax=Malania oleifera TaxID=397392 RepID=UPI0025AE3396|nr:photosynthetic NDH subunit of lumenal location 3, chloroplastic-like [Malania oleifera]